MFTRNHPAGLESGRSLTTAKMASFKEVSSNIGGSTKGVKAILRCRDRGQTTVY